MPKWIDLKERQPKPGQLVVVRGPGEFQSTLMLTLFGSPYTPTYGSTHWYPLPALHEEPDPEREELRREHPRVLERCEGIEVNLRNMAPLIDWSVRPAATFMSEPEGAWDAFSIKGRVEISGVELSGTMLVSEMALRDERFNALERAAGQIVNGLAREMLK